MGNWFSSLPGAIAQGLIWGIMAIGVYITYRILDIADLTVDGSICTGAAVCTVLIMRNINPWLALLCAFLVGLVAGSITGALHIGLGIPAILAGILTQMALWSVNLKILGKANQAIPARSYTVLLSQMDIPAALLLLGIATAAVIGMLYLFFGTELGCGIRATGCNPAMSRAQGINTGVNKVIGLAAVQRSGRAVRRTALPVSGVCRHQYGARRRGHRACRCRYRRGGRAAYLSEFCRAANGGCNRSRYLLSRVPDGYFSRLRRRPAQDVLGGRSCAVPRYTIPAEDRPGGVPYVQGGKGREQPCLRCAM